jgi:hypothetical protein
MPQCDIHILHVEAVPHALTLLRNAIARRADMSGGAFRIIDLWTPDGWNQKIATLCGAHSE